MDNKLLINTGNINQKILITDSKVKQIKKTEQLQRNE